MFSFFQLWRLELSQEGGSTMLLLSYPSQNEFESGFWIYNELATILRIILLLIFLLVEHNVLLDRELSCWLCSRKAVWEEGTLYSSAPIAFCLWFQPVQSHLRVPQESRKSTQLCCCRSAVRPSSSVFLRLFLTLNPYVVVLLFLNVFPPTLLCLPRMKNLKINIKGFTDNCLFLL